MPESQEASELFVGLSHISALTFRCLLICKLLVFDLYKWNGSLKDIQLHVKKQNAGLSARMCQYAKSSLGLLL